MRVKFFGATKNVTGSCTLLQTGEKTLLVDCGLFQERAFRKRNWDPFPSAADEIDGVLLTHAHLDHCGRLPKLIKEGYSGPIYGTPATLQIAAVVLRDSAHIQAEDAEFKRLRHKREARKTPIPEAPLYTPADAEDTIRLFRPVDYREILDLGGVQVEFHDAGHIFGSAMLKLRFGENRTERTLLFSGDVGRWDKPIIGDPTSFTEADYVFMESTYGDRTHERVQDIESSLEDVITRTNRAGGNVLIPSFAIERAQEVLYYLNKLRLADRIPHNLVFVDSPMATAVTGVFENNPGLFDREMSSLVKQRRSPFHFLGLQFVRSVAESKAINHLKGTAIIIAGSGMCTGGRIKHHLFHNIERKESTVLFVGYQAEGTLGRYLLEEPEEARILGQRKQVRARIARIDGLSAHADRDELMRWLSSIRKPPRRLFLLHGEARSVEALGETVREARNWEVSIPEYMNETTLD